MNFDNTSVTIIATACLGGGIAAIYGAYRQHVAANRFRATPTSQIGGLTDGYREIKGRIAKGAKKLRSPMAGKQCVYYAFTVTETVTESDNGNLLKEIISDKKSTRCYLDDGTGTAAIELDGAELVLDVDHHDNSGSFNAASPKLDAILKRYGESSKGYSKGVLFNHLNHQLKYEETILEVGDELYVLGPAKMVNGTICFKPIRGQSLIVSDKSERDLLRNHDSNFSLLNFAGGVLFVIAAGCMAYLYIALEVLSPTSDTAVREVPRNGSIQDDPIREADELNRGLKATKEERKAYDLQKLLRPKN